MHCASCEATIGNALKKADGVIDASVSYPSEQANIEFDPKKISVDELIRIIKTTGYEASSAEEEKVFLTIGGMTCASCAQKIEKSIKRNKRGH